MTVNNNIFLLIYTSDTIELSHCSTESEADENKDMKEGESAEVNDADQYKEEELKEEVTETKEEWKLIRWISLILLRLKLSFNLSNAIFSMLLDANIFHFLGNASSLIYTFPQDNQ